MNTQTINTTIEPESLLFLPEEVKKYWIGWQKVKVITSPDTILITKTEKPKKWSFRAIDHKLKEIGKKISKKDIEDAIKWARGQK